MEAGIAIGPDGTIYVGANEHSGTGSRWFAISPEGGLLWDRSLPRTWNSMPAIGEDGTLYLNAGAPDDPSGQLVAIDATGGVRWEQDGLDRLRGSPAIAPDGTIYVAGGHHLYALDPQGTERWTYRAGGDVFFISSPAVGSAGTIYVGGVDNVLYAINADGSERWTFDAAGVIHSSPSVGADGAVYFTSIGSSEGRLHALNPDGTERWSVKLPTRLVSSSPSIGPDGTVYVTSSGVTAVAPHGAIRWNVGCGTNAATPLVGADGAIYFAGCAQGPGGHAIYAVDADGDLLWDYRTGGTTLGSGAIGLDGTIYAATFSESYDVTLHAITETSPTNGGFDGAPWPTARGNRANNGRAGG